MSANSPFASFEAETDLERAMAKAQQLAFAPISFALARCLRNTGLLRALQDGPKSAEMLSQELDLPPTSVPVLLEGGLSIGALRTKTESDSIDQKTQLYGLTKMGHLLFRDKMTQVNMDFVHDVCYRAMFHLEESLRKGRPTGLSEILPQNNTSETVYQALSQLDSTVQKSWLDFDHFYSDSAFNSAASLISPPRHLLDVGGNTGRFSRILERVFPETKVTICDLPGQIQMAQKEARPDSLVGYFELDILDEKSFLPKGADAIWMSQFLVCFSPEQVGQILAKCRDALEPEGKLYILDTFWDRQTNPISRDCLIHTSPYFSAVANSVSRMYSYQTVSEIAAKMGWHLNKTWDELGHSHTLLEFSQQSSSQEKRNVAS